MNFRLWALLTLFTSICILLVFSSFSFSPFIFTCIYLRLLALLTLNSVYLWPSASSFNPFYLCMSPALSSAPSLYQDKTGWGTPITFKHNKNHSNDHLRCEYAASLVGGVREWGLRSVKGMLLHQISTSKNQQTYLLGIQITHRFSNSEKTMFPVCKKQRSLWFD